MKITVNDVEYVARLARLELTQEEKEKFTGQLESILEFVDQLNRVDTSHVPPTRHAVPLSNVWREDLYKPCPAEMRESILANAPEREEDFFKVKKVIE